MMPTRMDPALRHLRLLGLVLIFSGLLSLAGVAAQFSPALLITAAFIAAMGGIALWMAATKLQRRLSPLEVPLVLNQPLKDVSLLRRELAQLQQAATQMQLVSRRLVEKAEQGPVTSEDDWSDSSRQVAEKAADASRITDEAALIAERSHEKIQALRAASDRMETILERIGEVTARSNLLALNVTIVAARGSDVGEKFSMVARSVRQFAEETRQVIESIGAHVEEIRMAASEAVLLVQDMAATLRKVSEVAGGLQWSAERQRTLVPAGALPSSAWRDEAHRALSAANHLREQAARLDIELEQLSEVA